MYNCRQLITCLALSTSIQAVPLTVYPEPQHKPTDAIEYDCCGIVSSDKSYVCGDTRLGPVHVPNMYPMSAILSAYDRFGGHTPKDYLSRWWNSTSPGWTYPPENGFLLDGTGRSIFADAILPVGTLLDRFGKETGDFFAAAETPYAQRSLPPTNLDRSPSEFIWPFPYHIYEVIKPLRVRAGVIAPWFDQPGLGAQYYTGGIGNPSRLREMGYLKETIAPLLPPPSQPISESCQ